jgi:PAS domain-containing protein/DNA-binding CsgD family transcriptional regulator
MTDEHRLSELIGKIYDTALDGREWPELLRLLSATFSSHGAMVANIDAQPIAPPTVITSGLDISIIEEWRECVDHVDLWYKELAMRDYGASYTSEQLVPPGRLLASGFYADILRPNGVKHCLGGSTIENAQRKWIFAVYRGDPNGEFSERDQRIFGSLTPHFDRAIAFTRQFDALAMEREAFSTLLDQVECGLVAIGGRGRVVYANREALNIARASKAFRIVGDRIRTWLPEDQRKLDLALHRIGLYSPRLDEVSQKWLTISRASGRNPFQVMIIPVTPEANERLGAPSATALVCIRNPEKRAEINQELLKELYGLSPAEARLCCAIFDSGSLTKATESLGVSRNTGKSQLASVFQKVGVNSQSSLVRELSFACRAGMSPLS